MHARSPPAAFRHTFLLTLMRAELKTNKNKVAEQRNFLCGAACYLDPTAVAETRAVEYRYRSTTVQ